MDLALTQPNAAALEQYADLVGVSPQEFLNAFLEGFLISRCRIRKPVTGKDEF